MPPPKNVDEFLALMQRSELVAEDRLREFGPQERELSPKRFAASLVTAGLLTRFQAEQLLLGKYRGFSLGKYRVLERIGFGGNGTVYLCEHSIVRRKVAIKVLPTNRADSPAALARFYREARAAGALDHPHLVKAHDIDQENGLHFLVMDYVDGTNLQELVTRCGPLEPLRAAHYISQAAWGLEAAHAAGLVHRDVKPGNLLLDRRGVIRVSDLGLARFHCDNEDPLTLRFEDKMVLGTADYVAPEQALNSHDVDGRADVYSLGATFYFLLTGQPPFPEGKAAKKLMAHQVQQPRPVNEVRAEVPAEMADVVARMLAKRPQERYQTPAEVAAALEPWTSIPIPQPPEEEMPQLSPAARAPASGIPDPSSEALRRSARPRSSGVRSAVKAEALEDAVGGPISGGKRSGSRPSVGSRSGSKSKVRPPSSGSLGSSARRKSSESKDSRDSSAKRAGSDATPSGSRRRTHPEIRAVKTPTSIVRPRKLQARGWRGLMRNPWTWRVALILLLGALAGVALRWILNKPADATPVSAVTPAVDNKNLTVRLGGGQGAFATVAAALRTAQPGSVIQIEADTWEEILDAAVDVDGVRIVGRNSLDKFVHWRAPVGRAANTPLMRIWGSRGFSVSAIEFDGASQVEDLLLVEGTVGNIALENLRFKGFRRSAITFRNCVAPDSKPLTVRDVRVMADQKTASAIAFEAQANTSNRNIVVHDCRLEGPFDAAAAFNGPAGGVAFTDNRIYKASNGFLLRKTSFAPILDLTLTRNTLCDISGAGLNFQTAPAATSHVLLDSNLFARTAVLARVDSTDRQTPWLSPETSRNACDLTSKEGFPRLQAATASFELGEDPEDDVQFLRYAASSPLVQMGSPGAGPVQEKLPEDPLERARSLVGRKDWTRAVDAYVRAQGEKNFDQDGHFWFEYAAALLLAGKQGDYHAACLHMLQTDAKSMRGYHVARACTLTPGNPQEIQQAADKAAPELQGSANEFWSLTEQGALAYRNGAYAEAVPLFEKSMKFMTKPGNAILNWMWLALCYQHLGQPEEARRWLEKGVQFLDERPEVSSEGDPTVSLHLHNWLEAWILRREAESLLAVAKPVKGKGKP